MSKADERDRLRAIALERMASKSSGGGASALGAIGKLATKQLPYRSEAREKGKNLSPSGVTATLAVPPEAKPKRGRPLQRDKDKTLAATKPWVADGMDRSTWYRRRQKEAKK